MRVSVRPQHDLECLRKGWRLSGDLPLRIGQSFPMTVLLPNQERVFVAAGIIRWKRADEGL